MSSRAARSPILRSDDCQMIRSRDRRRSRALESSLPCVFEPQRSRRVPTPSGIALPRGALPRRREYRSRRIRQRFHRAEFSGPALGGAKRDRAAAAFCAGKTVGATGKRPRDRGKVDPSQEALAIPPHGMRWTASAVGGGTSRDNVDLSWSMASRFGQAEVTVRGVNGLGGGDCEELL